MCNYKYINKGKNNDGKSCAYPQYYSKYNETLINELPIDEDGFCLFHSKNEEWKIQNKFKERFFELIEFKEIKNKDLDKLKWGHKFSGFIFPKYEKFEFNELQFSNSLDFSTCIFNVPVSFLNLTLPNIDFQHSIFKSGVLFKNCIFKDTLYSQKSTFDDGIHFLECKMPQYIMFDNSTFNNITNSAGCEVSIKKCTNLNYVSFESAKIAPRFTLDFTDINDETVFNNCTFQNEFFLENATIDNVVSFKEAKFTLEANTNPMNSAISFFNILLTENAKIQFVGQYPQEDVVKSELGIAFKETPTKGTISFENFNLNKIYPDDKVSLLKLEKEGVVEIGKGCRKYYAQTDIFAIATNDSTQSIITEIINVFCNYFKLNESYNLGIEITERTTTELKYFYFTDEVIEKAEFVSKIKRNETKLWDTLSNLTNVALTAISTDNINLMDCLIQLDGWWKMLGLRVVKNRIDVANLTHLVNAISLDKKNEDEVTQLFKQINQQFTKAIENNQLILNLPNMSNINFNAEVKAVTINDYSQQILQISKDNNWSQEEQEKVTKIVEIVKAEPQEKKESKLKELAQEWLPTIAGMVSEAVKPFVGL